MRGLFCGMFRGFGALLMLAVLFLVASLTMVQEASAHGWGSGRGGAVRSRTVVRQRGFGGGYGYAGAQFAPVYAAPVFAAPVYAAPAVYSAPAFAAPSCSVQAAPVYAPPSGPIYAPGGCGAFFPGAGRRY